MADEWIDEAYGPPATASAPDGVTDLTIQGTADSVPHEAPMYIPASVSVAAPAASDSSDQWIDEAVGPPKQWNLIDAAKQLGSGSVEGIAGMVGLAADLNPTSLYFRFAKPDAEKGISFHNPLTFETSNAIDSALEPYLAEKDPNYRYTRTIGQFVGPQLAMGAVGKAGQAVRSGSKLLEALASQGSVKGVASVVPSAVAAQAAEDVTGDKVVAPFVAAAGAGLLPSLAIGGAKAIGSLFRNPSAAEVRGSAAKAFKSYTGLTEQEVSDAIAKAPKDELGGYMTTAELTDNGAVAQLEQKLTEAGAGSAEYNRRAGLRSDLRDSILDSASSSAAVNPEGLGSDLKAAAGKIQGEMSEEAKKLWKQVPRMAPVKIGTEQAELRGLLRVKQGGLPLGSKVRLLADQFLDPKLRSLASSGKLQDIRSDALSLLRDANLTTHETNVLTALAAHDGLIDSAMSKSLKGEAYNRWKAARDATAAEKATFAQTTVGGTLTNPATRASNVLDLVFKGDKQSIQELKAAIKDDPALLEQVKRGILQSVPRDVEGRLTPKRFADFVEANENGLRALFGDEQFGRMLRISKDLQSQAKVGKMAWRSSAGNSVTSQRTTAAGAVRDSILESLIPGGGLVGKMFSEAQKAAATKALEQINEQLLRASLDPKFALELVKTPTAVRVRSLTERLAITIGNAAENGARAGAIEVARPGDTQQNEQPNPRFDGASGQRAAQQRAPQGASSSRATMNQVPTGTQRSAASPASVHQSATDKRRLGSYPDNRPKVGTTPAPATKAGKPAGVQDVKALVSKLPPLVQAVIAVESSGNPDAVSPKGARGLMQLMPDVAKALGVTDPHDPVQNIRGGIKLLNEESQRYKGDVKLTLAAYNLGSKKLNRIISRVGRDWSRIYPELPAETKHYVMRVIGKANQITRV